MFKNTKLIYVLVNLLSSIAPIIILPYMARQITIEDFGAYAIYYAGLTIIGSVINLSLNNAFFKTNNLSLKRYYTLINLIIVIVLISVIFLIGVFILVFFPLINDLSLMLFFTVSLICVGLNNTYHSFYLSEAIYMTLSLIKIIAVFSTIAFQFLFLTIDPSLEGLVSANLISLLLVSLTSHLFYKKYNYKRIKILRKKNTVKLLLNKNLDLIKYTTCSSLLNNLTNFLPEILLKILFGNEKVGIYNMAMRLLNMPLSLISSSIQDIFKERVSNTDNVRNEFFVFLFPMLIFSLLSLLFINIFSSFLIDLFLSEKWSEVTDILNIIMFFVLIKFISAPLSFLWLIKGKEKNDFKWQVIYMFYVVSIFTITYFYEISFYKHLTLLTIVVSFHYILAIFLSYRYSREK